MAKQVAPKATTYAAQMLVLFSSEFIASLDK
jgi:hypothetical protein